MDAVELKRVLGENIRRLRKEKGLTQDVFAELMDRTSGSISRFESGKQFMGVDLLVQIANYFAVSVDDLIRPEGTASHFNTITSVLSGQTDDSLAKLEPFIQLWVSQYGVPTAPTDNE